MAKKKKGRKIHKSVRKKTGKRNLLKISVILLTLILVVGLLIWGFGLISRIDIKNIGSKNLPEQKLEVMANADDDPVLGDKNSPVTIIEFGDYQCPFCRKFWVETLPQIKTEYIDTGKARLVWRDLPLTPIHPAAQASAEAAECVKEIGGDIAYYRMHDKIFEEQNILDSGSTNGSVTKTVSYNSTDLKLWAKEVGYDIDSCLNSGRFTNEIKKDVSDAGKAGGRGTPYFVILKSGEEKGEPVGGAYPFETFKQIIDSKL